jgi:dipeptidyl aminopeptidase/acylaminoacyl peptidase
VIGPLSKAAARAALPAASLALAMTSAVVVSSLAASPAPVASPRPGLVDGEGWIAYQTSTSQRGGAHAVHLVRPDGTGAFFALEAVDGGEQLHPDWSPDGRSIALDAADRDGTYDVWVADTSDWSADRIVDCTAPCLWVQEPAFSPDGKRIAYQRRQATDAGDISMVEILDVGSGETAVVYQTGPDLWVNAPRWSPDGTSLVFEQVLLDGDRFIGVSLEVLDLAAPGTTREIVPVERYANNADWSPDGALIAFSAPGEFGEPGGARSDIWVVAPDGSRMRQVTDVAAGGGSAVQPTFTPDGGRIMFKLTDRKIGAIDAMATIAIDGTDVRPASGGAYSVGWHARLRPTP